MKRFIAYLQLFLFTCMSCNPQAFAGGPFIWGADNRAQGLQSSGAVFSNGQPIDYNGPMNRIGNSDAIINTSGWSTYADAAGVTPVDCTGGSPTITWTRSTSSPLRGSANFLETKDAANRQGEGVAYAFTLDPADAIAGKTMAISVDAGPSANYVTADNRIYIYDVTNATLITPTSVNVSQTAGTFQTTWVATTSQSYRLCIHVASTNANAYTVKYDNVFVGQVVPSQNVASGTFSPQLVAGTGGAFSGQSASAFYTKIDTVVYFTFLITGTLGSGSGSLTLTGLPFTSKNTSGIYYGYVASQNNWDLPVSSLYAIAELAPNATSMTFYANKDAAAATLIDASAVASRNISINVTGFYFTN